MEEEGPDCRDARRVNKSNITLHANILSQLQQDGIAILRGENKSKRKFDSAEDQERHLRYDEEVCNNANSSSVP